MTESLLPAIYKSQRTLFEKMAAAWQEAGASAFSIWTTGQLLLCEPPHAIGKKVDIRAPIYLDRQPIGELRVSGIRNKASESLLTAEARLISRLVKQEHQIEEATLRSLHDNDLILGLYQLMQNTRQHPDILSLMQDVMDRITNTGTFLETEARALLIEYELSNKPLSEKFQQDPPDFLSQESARHYLERIRQAKKPNLLLDDPQTSRRKALIVPIKIADEVHGMLAFVNKKDGDFMSPDIKMAEAIAEYVGSRVEHLRLYQENLAKARVTLEAEIARDVQIKLLPRQFPTVAGLDIDGRSEPASRLGGDFYDYTVDKQGTFTFAVGDVSGKGMGAALMASRTQTALQIYATAQTESGRLNAPADIFSEITHVLYDNFTDVTMFVTLFLGRYTPHSNKITFANAGHSPVIYCPAAGQPRLLEADGPPIGTLDDNLCENQTIPFKKNDILVVATDGLNEEQNDQEEMFGIPRMMDNIHRNAHLPAAEIVKRLYNAVAEFGGDTRQTDDRTILLLKRI